MYLAKFVIFLKYIWLMVSDTIKCLELILLI